MFATIKLLAVYITLGSLSGIIGIPYSLLVGNVNWMYWAGMTTARLGLRVAGIRTRVLGMEHVPPGKACIFMCNHVSNLDPPLVMPMLPGRCTVLLKKELMKIPILGIAMRLGHFIPVGRGGTRAEAVESVRASVAAVQAGLGILVFPEGTRSPDGRLRGFKKGSFFLAEQTGAPIIPVAISGTQRMMRKGSVALAPGEATIQMLPPIDPKSYGTRAELMQAVQDAMASALPPEMRPLTEATSESR